MKTLNISKEQAREIAYDWFDAIVKGVKELEEQKQTCTGMNKNANKTA